MEAMQPLRLELAERGEWLLANPRLPAYHRPILEFMLDNAYSGWVMVLSTVLIPIVFIEFVLRPRRRAAMRAASNIADKEVRREFGCVDGLFFKSAIAANPLFACVVLVERVVLIAVLVLLKKPLEIVDLILDKALTADNGFSRLRRRPA